LDSPYSTSKLFPAASSLAGLVYNPFEELQNCVPFCSVRRDSRNYPRKILDMERTCPATTCFRNDRTDTTPHRNRK